MSIGTLLRGYKQPLRTVAIFLGWPGVLPAEIVLRQTGWRFRIRSPMDAWIVKETCLDEDYLWSSPVLRSDWIVVDIGAGIGDFTVFAAKRCLNGQVFAYEPLRDSYRLLEENLALNDLSNAHAVHSAVASKRGVMEIDHTVTGEAVSTRFLESDLVEGIPALGLADLLDTLPKGECDFMKIDCEGCEFDLVLNSPPSLLSRIIRISLEFHVPRASEKLRELVRHLENAGYQVQLRGNPVYSTLGFLYAERVPGAT